MGVLVYFKFFIKTTQGNLAVSEKELSGEGRWNEGALEEVITQRFKKILIREKILS